MPELEQAGPPGPGTTAADLLRLVRRAESAGDGERLLEAADRLLDLLAELPDGESSVGLWATAHLSVAGACFDLGDIDRAEFSFRRAVELFPAGLPSYYEAMLGLGLCLDQKGQWTEARSIYEEVIRDSRAGDAARRVARRNLVYAEGVAAFARADFEASRALFVKAVTLEAGDDDFRSDILLWVGACHARLGQYAAARDAYEELVGLPKAQESVKSQARQWIAFAEGQLHFAARRFGEARTKFEEILASRGAGNEFRSGVTLMVAHCCAQLRDYSQARRRYRFILKTRTATAAQKFEARQARQALPSWPGRWLRGFVTRLGLTA